MTDASDGLKRSVSQAVEQSSVLQLYVGPDQGRDPRSHSRLRVLAYPET
jgi:hypothetical protein